MSTHETPTTPATDALDRAGVVYRLVHQGRVRSAEEAAERRGIPLEALAKTLVVRVAEGDYRLVMVPGDASMDYAKLRELLGVRRLTMPDADEAKDATGYERGTITPMGAGHPAILDGRLASLPEISLGSGVHGWAINLAPADLVAAFDVSVADIASSR